MSAEKFLEYFSDLGFMDIDVLVSLGNILAEPLYAWLILAILFALFEILTPGLLFFFAFSLGACCASLSAFIGTTLQQQCFIFLITTGVSFALLCSRFANKKKCLVPTNIHGLIHQQAIVTKTVSTAQRGRVRVKQEEWCAKTENTNTILNVGTPVIIEKIVGNTLVVRINKKQRKTNE